MLPFNVGAPELIILLVIILLVFGVGKLPEVGGAIGKGMREFRKSVSGADEVPPKQAEIKKESQENEQKA